MHHADSSLIPPTITTKKSFWIHVHTQLALLLEDQRNWITNLSNASALIYHSLRDFPLYFGTEDRAVNWCGFYLHSSLFPSAPPATPRLLLGPFNGKPACQWIPIQPPKGVCANSFVHAQTVVVGDVESYPGHIACDGGTKSEFVVPLVLIKKQRRAGIDWNGDAVIDVEEEETRKTLGVLDLDCLGLNGFDDDDKEGLERIAKLIVDSCDW